MPIYIVAAVLLIAADQAVKYWALTSFAGAAYHSLIQDVFT